MNHLLNCHNEWGILFGLLSSLPFLGMWIQHKLNPPQEDK
jgi:hypothetical protein